MMKIIVSSSCKWMCTRFESLHCHCGGFVPQALVDFSELTGSQLPQQLDGAALDLPLVHRVVGQTVSLRGLHLSSQRESSVTTEQSKTA